MVRKLWRSHEQLRYLTVGVWNTGLAYAAYFAVYALGRRHLHYLVISTLAHMCAVVNAFACQRFFVFHSRSPWFPAFVRFNLVQLLILVGSLSGLVFLVEVLHWQPFLSQLTLMTVALVLSYVLNRYYSFRA